MLDEFVPVGVFDSLDSELLWEKCILQSPDDPISKSLQGMVQKKSSG